MVPRNAVLEVDLVLEAEDVRRVWGVKVGGDGGALHNGILSCFFHGLVIFFPANMLSARQIRRRVVDGVMTSSM